MKKFYNINQETGEYELVKDIYIGNDDKCHHVDYSNNNYIIKLDEDTGLCELVLYDKPFRSPVHTEYNEELINSDYIAREVENYMSTRKFKLDENGCAVPIVSNASISDLVKTIKLGGKRAVKTFYDYALSNRWEYFVTFTFADEAIRNDKDLLYKAWKVFKNSIRLSNPDFKALAVYERFDKGGYHIHSIIGDCDLKLVPARNNKKTSEYYGDFLYSNFGGQIFNCLDWTRGYSTAVCIKPEDNQVQVVNYISKYMTKASAAPYGCRRFFHTQNLNCRKSIVGYTENFEEWTNKFGLKLAKDKNGIKVYRNYGTKFIEEKIDKKTIYELNLEDMVDMSTHQFDFSKLETNDEKIAEEMDILFRTQNAKQMELELETEDNTSKIIKKIEELKKTKQEGKGRERC